MKLFARFLVPDPAGQAVWGLESLLLAAAIGSFGLILNMAGVVVAFFYGYPQPSHEEGISLGLEDATPLEDGRTVAQHDEEVRHRRAIHLKWSRIGLGLMFLGFLLQLAAVWLAYLRW